MSRYSLGEMETLLEDHRQELHRFLVRRLGCADTADDLLQDIFLRLVNRKSVAPIHNGRTYLYRIAANLATDCLRRRRDTIDADTEAIELADDRGGPEEIVFRQQQLDRCLRVFECLSPLCLEVMVMNRLDGYTQPQIAEKLGISLSWVEKNIATAAKACAFALDDSNHCPPVPRANARGSVSPD